MGCRKANQAARCLSSAFNRSRLPRKWVTPARTGVAAFEWYTLWLLAIAPRGTQQA
jgi:hypothetical protein